MYKIQSAVDPAQTHACRRIAEVGSTSPLQSSQHSMATLVNNAESDFGFEEQLWGAVDKMRGNIGPSDCQHVAFWLVFLRYILDAFGAKRTTLLREDLADVDVPEVNTDAAVAGLNRGNAYRREFPQPTSQLVSAFEDIAGTLRQRRARNLSKLETLSQTRDLLLPKLISGETRIRKAVKVIEAAA